MKLFGKTTHTRRTLFAAGIALAGVTVGAHAQSTAEINSALADLYPAIVNSHGVTTFPLQTISNATATELEAAIQLISSTATVSEAGHGSHAGFGLPGHAAGDIGILLAGGAQTSATLAGDLIAGFKAGAVSGAPLDSNIPAVTGSAAAYGNFGTGADALEATVVGDGITADPTQLSAILDAAIAVTDPSPTAEATLFTAKATSAAVTAAGTTLKTLFTNLATAGSIVSGNVPSFLAYAVKDETSPATQEAVLSGYTSGNSDGTVITLATNVMAAINGGAYTATDAILESIVVGFTADSPSDAPLLTSVLQASLTSPILSTAALQSTYVGNVIGLLPTQLANILTAAVANYSSSPATQALIFTGNTTAAKLTAAATTLNAVASAVASSGSLGAVTSTASADFLAYALKYETTAATQEAVIEGYTTGLTDGNLSLTASNVIAAANGYVTATIPVVYTNTSLEAIYTGFTAGGVADANLVPNVLDAILGSAFFTNDALRTTYTGDIITASTVSAEYLIADAAALYISTAGATNPELDVANLVDKLKANTQIGATGIVGISGSIAAIDFPITTGNLSATTGNFPFLVAVAQGAIEAVSASANQIVQTVAQEAVGLNASASSEATFAGDLAGALVVSGNGLSVTPAIAANIVTGVAQAFQSYAGAPEAAAAGGAAPYFALGTATSLNTVVQPVLAYYSTLNATETGAIATAVAGDSGALTSGSANPAQTSAFLILGAKTNQQLIDEIATGVGTSALLSDYSNNDAFAQALVSYLSTSAADIADVGVTLALDSGYTPYGVAADVAAVNATARPIVSGSITAVAPAYASQIAYAAANTIPAPNGSSTAAYSTAVGTADLAIAVDVVKALSASTAFNDAASISGTVGNLVPDVYKGMFTESIAKQIATTSGSADATFTPGVALAVAQTVGIGDGGQVATIESIADDAAKVYLTSDTTDIAYLVNYVAADYNGALYNSLNGGGTAYLAPPSLGLYAASLAKAFATSGSIIVSDLLNTALSANNLQGTSIPTVAQDFTTDLNAVLPAYSTEVAHTLAGIDPGITGGTVASEAAEAGSLTTAVLTGVGSTNAKTDAPIIANAVAGGITSLSATEAIDIAESAAVTSGVTATNENLIATDVLTDLAPAGTSAQQTALNVIAQYVSNEFATVTAPTSPLSDQEGLAKALAADFTGLNQEKIAYYVGLAALGGGTGTTFDSNFSEIAASVLGVTSNAGLKTLTGINAFAGPLITDLTGNASSGFSDVAHVTADLATDVTGVTGLAASISEYIVNQELGGTTTQANAEAIGADFAAVLPTTAVEIATQVTNPSLFTGGYTAEQAGTIGETVAAALPTTGATASTNPATTGTIAVIAAYAGSGTSPTQAVLNDSLQAVADVFGTATQGGTLAAADVTPLELDLALQADSSANETHTMTIPSIVAAFVPNATEATVATELGKLLGTSSSVNDWINAIDLVGTALAYDPSIDSMSAALVTAVAGDLTTDMAAIEASTPYTTYAALHIHNSFTQNLDALLGIGVTDASNNDYNTVTANETPIQNL